MAEKLMVVAHPDDEIIFGGAHLLSERGWKVVCVTNGNNKVRMAEFKRVMKSIGAEYEIWTYRDTYSRDFDVQALKRDLARLLRKNRYEKVVTHGLSGEYGHPQHQVIGEIVRSVAGKRLYVFSIGKNKLPPYVLQRKERLLRMYRSQQRTIWELCHGNGLNRYIEKEYFALVKK